MTRCISSLLIIKKLKGIDTYAPCSVGAKQRSLIPVMSSWKTFYFIFVILISMAISTHVHRIIN
jgi:hypothetical protein